MHEACMVAVLLLLLRDPQGLRLCSKALQKGDESIELIRQAASEARGKLCQLPTGQARYEQPSFLALGPLGPSRSSTAANGRGRASTIPASPWPYPL